jgi:hypothetical protein
MVHPCILWSDLTSGFFATFVMALATFAVKSFGLQRPGRNAAKIAKAKPEFDADSS